MNIRLFIATLSIILAACTAHKTQTVIRKKQNKTAISSEKDDSLAIFYSHIIKKQTDPERKKANEAFRNSLNSYSNTDLFNAPLDSLRNTIAITDAPDGRFRIIHWTVYFNKGTYDFFGFILHKEKDSIVKYILTDKSATLQKPEDLTTTNSDWYGALYYDIVKSGTAEEPYYVLLGWDGNDLFSNRKVIDALWFDENDAPNFGKPVFYFSTEDIRQRVVFEFAESSTMRLRYEPKKSMIVFDHLSPAKPQYEGKTEYYGSDFTFDALVWDYDKWMLKENIDIKNERTKLSKKAKNK